MILLFSIFPLILLTKASFIEEFNLNEYNRLTQQISTNFSRYDTIVDYLKSATKVCEYASLDSIGSTYEGRNIPVIKFSSRPGTNKPIIVVDAGIHAREWIAPSTALYLIMQLCSPSNKDLIENVEWQIIPVLNPDGYEFTHTDDRFWRKTRSWNGNNCYGTDLNRNFDFHWMETGSSFNECESTYAGAYPFSETEARHFKSYMEAIANRIKLYVSLHAYGPDIMYPNGYKNRPTYNNDELNALGKKVAFNIGSKGGTDYNVGMTAEVMYESSGGSDDWMKGVLKIPLAYTIELPGEGFDPPPSMILPVGAEIFNGFEVFHDYVVQNFGTHPI